MNMEDVHDADCVIVAVAHNEFRDLTLDEMKKFFKQEAGEKVIIDVKGLYKIDDLNKSGLSWWRL